MNKRIFTLSILVAVLVAAISLGLTTLRPPIAAVSTGHSPEAQKQAAETFGKLPLTFEVNAGQTDEPVKFVARGAGYSLFLADTEAVLSLRGSKTKAGPSSRNKTDTVAEADPNVLRMSLVGADMPREISGEEQMEGKANYLIGDDPANWRTDVAYYAKVRYEGVYAGIDQVYYGNQGQLEYDFIVAPEADHGQIKLRFDGAEQIKVDDATGELVLGFRDGSEIRQHRPIVYQEVAGQKLPVEASYKMGSTDEVGFVIGKYDRTKTLVIDPVLVYSTYLGGSSRDQGAGIAIDAAGNAYIVGTTSSTNFPSVGSIQPPAGLSDVFVTKINAAGNAWSYSTYLGGSADDFAWEIAVDESGSVYIVGETTSVNFPRANALQPTFGGDRDAFVAKLNAAGSALVYSTYLGGSNTDVANGVAVDSSGNAYVTGNTLSANFPTAAAFQPALNGFDDAFVTKINAAGSALVYSSYLGGTSSETGYSIAVDTSGSAYVTGITHSVNFPTASPIQSQNNSQYTGFVTKFNTNGSTLVFSTYLGGNQGSDAGLGNAIAVDTSGNAYVAGQTTSTSFPTTNAIQPLYGGDDFDGFVTKLNPQGSAFVYSTYLGGNAIDIAFGISADSSGRAYVSGYTYSQNFPLLNPLQPNIGGSNADAFVTSLSANGSSFVYSTYLGGGVLDSFSDITVDPAGTAYATGITQANNFPTVNPIQGTYGGSPLDAIVVKIANAAGTPTPTATPMTTATPTNSPTATPTATPTNTPTATPTSTPTATPTGTPTATPTATPTSTPTSTPTATPTPGDTGFEGDIAPRNNGDGVVVSTDVTQMRRFATGLDQVNVAFNEFQRADCAPRGTFGDALVNSGDVVQARRYATGLDPLTDAGGAVGRPSVSEQSWDLGLLESLYRFFSSRSLTVVPTDPVDSKVASFDVVLSAEGDESASSFVIEYDPAILTFSTVTIGKEIAPETNLTTNSTEAGRIVVLLDSSEPLSAAGKVALITITFDIVNVGEPTETSVRFDPSKDAHSFADAFGELLPGNFFDGMTIVGTSTPKLDKQ